MAWHRCLRAAAAVLLAGAGAHHGLAQVLADGFESGDARMWSGGVPRPRMASRTTGVAPLAVFFEVVDANALLMRPPLVAGRREYADYRYHWDFGDPSAGAWAGSGEPRSLAEGYLAAHVFEVPGTWTVTLEVVAPDGLRRTYSEHVTVLDPDHVYAGSDTVCCSTGVDFSGCPPGAQQVTTGDFAELGSHLAPSRRILLRRGDTWVTTASLAVTDNPGPVTIGAFGQCASPDARGLCANAPVVVAQTGTTSALFSLLNVGDLRLMDLRFQGNLSAPGVIGGDTDLVAILHLRLGVTGFVTAMGNSHWETDGHDQVMIVDCDASGSDGNVVYVGSERLAVLGNHLWDSQDTHVLRVWQAYRGVISHNEIHGANVAVATGRHALKLHGPREDMIGGPDPTSLAHRTQHVIVSDNLFGGSGPWAVGVGPQDSASDERLSDIVVEDNRFFAGYGTVLDPVQVALLIWASHVTVRNNIFCGAGSSQYYTGLLIGQRGVEPPPENVRVLNNTIFKHDNPGGYTGYTAVEIGGGASGVTVRNTLAHFSATGTVVQLIQGAGPGVVADHNLLADEPGLVDPNHPEWLLKDFALEPGSPAVDAGTPVPVHRDFTGLERPAGLTWDLGAFELGDR